MRLHVVLLRHREVKSFTGVGGGVSWGSWNSRLPLAPECQDAGGHSGLLWLERGQERMGQHKAARAPSLPATGAEAGYGAFSPSEEFTAQPWCACLEQPLDVLRNLHLP